MKYITYTDSYKVRKKKDNSIKVELANGSIL